jgi:hypothetical protein
MHFPARESGAALNNQGRNLRVSRLDSPKPSTSEAGRLREGTDFWPILDDPFPSPGTPEEDQRFAALQTRLKTLWQNLSADDHVEQVVVVVPSLSLDPEELRKLKGIEHYEERLLFLLILLGMPRTRVVFVSSQPIHEGIVDYYLQLLPGVPYSHARRRLHPSWWNRRGSTWRRPASPGWSPSTSASSAGTPGPTWTPTMR